MIPTEIERSLDVRVWRAGIEKMQRTVLVRWRYCGRTLVVLGLILT